MPFFPGSGGGGGSGTTLISATITQTAHGLSLNNWVRLSGASTYVKAQADSAVNAEVVGIVTTVTDANNFKISTDGFTAGLTGLTANQVYYLSATTAGAMTVTEPSSVSSVSKPVFQSDTATSGYILGFRGSPAQGQTAVVSFVNATRSTNLTLAGGTDIAFDAVASGDIPMTAGVFSLIAGKTYHLYASLRVQGGQADFAWVDATTNVALVSSALGTAQGSSGVSDSAVDIIHTPSADQTVKLRVIGVGGSPVLNGGYGGASIVQIGASPVPVTLVGEYVGPNYGAASLAPTGTTTATAIDYMSVVLPTAGTWLINWAVRGSSNSTVSGGIASVLTDSANVVQANSEALSLFPHTSAANLQATSSGQYVVTTSGAATYKVRVYSISTVGGFALSDSNGRSQVVARKISGFTPSSGSTVDYVHANISTNSALISAVTDVVFNVATAGNIPLNTATGEFTLTAGKTYELNAAVAAVTSNGIPTSANFLTYQWVDSANVALVAAKGTGSSQVNSSLTVSAGNRGDVPANLVYTPNTNQAVKLRITAMSLNGITSYQYLSGGNTTGCTFATITQLGSSAVIAGVYPGNWSTYVPVVTSTTGTNPTLPTSATITGSYSVQGKTMFLNLKYYASAITGGADGTSSYAYSIPSGYQIDVTKAAIPSVLTNVSGSGLDGGVIGSGFGRNSTAANSSGLIVMPLSATTIGAYFEAATRLIGAGSLAATGAAQTVISMVCQIPLV